MSENADLEQAAALAEYAALRAEILIRQGHQHTFMTLNLTISGTVFGFALAQPSRVLVLLILPYITFMTSGRYIGHDYGIRQIADYVRHDLSPRVQGRLRWEEYIALNRITPGRRLYFGIDPLFIGFPGVAFAALMFCVYPLVRSLQHISVQDALLSLVWLTGMFLVSLSARNIWLTRKQFILNEWKRKKAKTIDETRARSGGESGELS